MAFRQSDGAVVWKSGDFLTSAAPPILIDFDGPPQLVFLAGGTVTALDPSTGTDPLVDAARSRQRLNCSTPIWGPDNILFVSSAYKAGSRAIQLTQQGDATNPEELWFTNRVRFMFLNAIRLGDFVYGTTGDFGPAFLTALNIKTGQAAWQHRGFGRASLLHADGKTIIMDEDGDLALARLDAGRRDGSDAGEDLRHDDVDGADAGRDDAVRARSRKDRRARTRTCRRRTGAVARRHRLIRGRWLHASARRHGQSADLPRRCHATLRRAPGGSMPLRAASIRPPGWPG